MNAACSSSSVYEHQTILFNFNNSHQTMRKSQTRMTQKDKVATHHVKKQVQHFFHDSL